MAPQLKPEKLEKAELEPPQIEEYMQPATQERQVLAEAPVIEIGTPKSLASITQEVLPEMTQIKVIPYLMHFTILVINLSLFRPYSYGFVGPSYSRSLPYWSM